jgi:hypothetical protein
MFLTSSSGQYQPYIPWKGESTYSITSSWSKPLLKPEGDSDNPFLGPAFKARPIKHWRKQLVPAKGSGHSRQRSVPDYPGSSTYLGNKNCQDLDNSISEKSAFIVENVTYNPLTDKNKGSYEKGQNGSNICIACNPEKKPIKSGMTEKLINPSQPGEIPKKKYCFSSREYLRSRCKTYDQRLSGTHIKDIVYSSSCNNNCESGKVIIIKKPNNRQYFVQGAVDSSSRLMRLKLNTLNKAAHSLKTKYGSHAANAAKYPYSGSSNYFISGLSKTKCQNALKRKTGAKTSCS